MNKRVLGLVGGTAVLVMGAIPVSAASLDLTNVTPGNEGTFAGTLGDISVAGSIIGAPEFRVVGVGQNFAHSIIDGSSPQFSNDSIYSPATPLGDKVGYVMFDPDGGTANLLINFGEAVINPIFHVANLDSMMYDFSSVTGLTGLSLLSSNAGADGDGLILDGLMAKDAKPLTIVGIAPTDPVPTEPTARSAYGSIQLLGSFTSLDITLLQNPGTNLGDGGAFTITTKPAEAVPEPAMALGLMALAGVGTATLKRHKQDA